MHWDVHHGNGTQSALYDNPNVLTISLHQDNDPILPIPAGFAGQDLQPHQAALVDQVSTFAADAARPA